MIEIAHCGQNQLSFNRATETIKRIYNIDISQSNVIKITEFVGKIVYDYVRENAYKIWNNRANLSIECKIKKGVLYIQIDGASVNTRVEDVDGSTWKENKLAIFYTDKDLFIRKDKSNVIKHKEFTSFLGNVDEFRILLFAKAVEMEYWKYEHIVVISDGATWIRNMITELFPEAIQILDLYHLKENIYDYGKYIFNGDMEKVEAFTCKIVNLCFENNYDEIINELDKYKDIKIPNYVCNLPTYLENNKDKINYTKYKNNGWFIGSGAIESSNKTVVQSRTKQAGMRWSIDGANYMITLRCFEESKHWDKVIEIVTNHLYG